MLNYLFFSNFDSDFDLKDWSSFLILLERKRFKKSNTPQVILRCDMREIKSAYNVLLKYTYKYVDRV